MSKRMDLTGMRFGRLTVISFSHSQGGTRRWKCLCDCGNERVVATSWLISGNTQSCGCKRTDTVREVCCTHGLAHEKPYNIWATIKQRCCNENNQDYPDYGGRGIKLCEEWESDFQLFYSYISKLPHYGEKGYSLDRVNNDGNYEPGNLRWATGIEQANNRRKRRWQKKPKTKEI